jgi:quercetin dioxygenase-like cupin family protein
MTESPKSVLAKIAASNVLNTSKNLPAIDILGPKIQFLSVAEEVDSEQCLMLVSVPPGVCVPLHSHADPEFFFVTEGTLEMLNQNDDAGWVVVEKAAFVEIPPGARHAFRNVSALPASFLCATTEQMGRFFSTVGEAAALDKPPSAPTSERISRFIAASERFGYWIGSPEENAAAGV